MLLYFLPTFLLSQISIHGCINLTNPERRFYQFLALQSRTLKRLDLADNGIANPEPLEREVFAETSGLAGLENLNLSFNKLSSVPGNRKNGRFFRGLLVYLKRLDLSNNQISSIGEMAFTYMYNLEWVDLSNNPLTRIEYFIFAGPKSSCFLFVNLTSPYTKTAFIDYDVFFGIDREYKVEGF